MTPLDLVDMRRVLQSPELLGREVVAVGGPEIVFQAGILGAVAISGDDVSLQLDQAIALVRKSGRYRFSAAPTTHVSLTLDWSCSPASVDEGFACLQSCWGEELSVSIGAADEPRPPRAWEPWLTFDGPASVASEGWIAVPLQARESPSGLQGIQICAHESGEFSIACVEEELADIVFLPGTDPAAIRVERSGVVEHLGRTLPRHDRIQPKLGETIRIRGIEAEVSVSHHTLARWISSVAHLSRSTQGYLAPVVTLTRSDHATRALLAVADEKPEAPRRYLLTGSPTRVGRSSDNEIVLRRGELSRNHCRIERRGLHDWVIDLGSTNGTHVNGSRIDGPHRLMHGDRVRPCNTMELRYVHGILSQDEPDVLAAFKPRRPR